MKKDLEELGYTQNYFPFTKSEIIDLQTIAEKANQLKTDDRKNIFKHFPLVRQLFEKALRESEFDLALTEYCFYIEKNTDDRNWPLLFHRDINLPSHINIEDEEKEIFLKNAVMFRLTLDTSDKNTGALKVIPYSHNSTNTDIVMAEEVFINTQEGEVIFFKPLLLHGSNKMKQPHKRRVFQALCIEKSK